MLYIIQEHAYSELVIGNLVIGTTAQKTAVHVKCKTTSCTMICAVSYIPTPIVICVVLSISMHIDDTLINGHQPYALNHHSQPMRISLTPPVGGNTHLASRQELRPNV